MTPQSAPAVPRIRLRGLHKRFGAKTVLDGFDLDVAPQESVVLLGESGSGKSVILKCILGLLQTDAGQVEIDGQALPPAQRREGIGMLFQGAALFDSLRVWENIAFRLLNGPARQRVPRPEARALALEKLALVGLQPATADLFPAELSGGMQKRVGLARAIMGNPGILFFDEPTTGLDPATVRRVDALILRCCAETRATALTVTHDIASARRIASRAILLKNGRIAWSGPMDTLEESTHPAVRHFLGLDAS